MKALLACLLVLVAAGCTGPAAVPAETAEPASETARSRVLNETLLRFEQTFDRTSTGVQAMARSGGGANCLMLVGTFTIVSGSAAAAWSPQTPVTPQMEVLLFVDREVVAVAQGRDKAAIEFADVTVENEGGTSALVTWQVAKGQVGAMYEQEGELTLAFDYWAAEPVAVDDNWSCAVGH